MDCFMCKGQTENKLTSFMAELENSIIIVKKVPSQVCRQCGETTYTHEVAKQLEKIVDEMRKVITEIAVTNYVEKAVA